MLQQRDSLVDATMMCVTVGPLQMMRDKEMQLVKHGYQAVAGPELLPMQYTVTAEYMLREGWTFKLLWSEPLSHRRGDIFRAPPTV